MPKPLTEGVFEAELDQLSGRRKICAHALRAIRREACGRPRAAGLSVGPSERRSSVVTKTSLSTTRPVLARSKKAAKASGRFSWSVTALR